MRGHRTLLAQLVDDAHLTREDAVERFELAARELSERVSVSPRQFGRWMAGESAGPRPAARRVLEHMFRTPVADLLGPPRDGAGRPGIDGEVPDGRQRPDGSAPDGEREVLDVAAARARDFALLAGKAGLADESVDQLYEEAHHYVREYPRRPLGELLGGIAELEDVLFSLLERRQRPTHARQLYFLAALTGGLLAKASHDQNEPHAALTQARTAFICADQADHNGLRAWVRGLQSLVSYWDGRPHDSIGYAQSGQEYAALAGSTTTVWLPLSEARAWATLGNVTETRAAVQRAEAARDAVVPDEVDHFGGLATFSRSRQLYYAADALSWLPTEAEPAGRYAAEAIAEYRDTEGPDWAFGDQAGSHADLAIARIQAGEVAGAAEALLPVLRLPADRRIRGIVNSTQRVHTALSRSGAGGREQRELQEAIEVFCRTPAAAALAR